MSIDRRLPKRWQGFVRGLLLGSGFLAAMGTSVAQVNISNVPLFLTSNADANIMFILDDSGSMHWEVTPDEVMGGSFYMFPRVAGNYGGADYNNEIPSFRSEPADGGTAQEQAYAAMMRSSNINRSYYNPSITYQPWSKPAGMAIAAVPAVVTASSSFTPAAINAAPHHPIRNTGVRDLTVNNTQNANWRFCTTYNGGTGWTGCGGVNATRTFFPAVYFRYNGGAVDVRASYTRIEIRPEAARPAPFTGLPYTGEGRTARTDCALAAVGSCTYAEEIRNFANWYTYYRSRMLASQAGIGRAFLNQAENLRVGFSAINKAAATIDGVNTRTVIQGVRPFSGANRNQFFSDLYTGVWTPANTPLRQALDDVGQYFSRTDNAGPWGAVPGSNDTTAHLSCRQSYSILMTDGYWNSNAASTAGATANADGTNGPTILGPNGASYTYNAVSPFTDARNNTLADVASYYWKNDLRTGLDNKVPSSARNPAFWQHMVTYGIGLGVNGNQDPATALNAIDNPAAPAINWADPTATNPAKIDDLLHAGVNSRGGFFSAANPTQFADQLSAVLRDIVARVAGSAASATSSAPVLQSDTLLYNTAFRSGDWSSTVLARRLDSAGVPSATSVWDAEQKLAIRAPGDRKIFTKETSTSFAPVELVFSNLSAAQQTALGVNPTGAPATTATGADRINWLRGIEHSQLRSRASTGTPSIIQKMGDIVGSDPVFVTRQDYGYGSALAGAEKSTYNAFRASAVYKNRPDVMYVGTNGGMLHAFHGGTPFVGSPAAMDADGGKELFAYVPSELLLPGATGTHAQINELMRPDYSHRYYVDGAAEKSDAYVNGAWKTVVVGTMGKGGRTVFALDVTDPENFNATKVLWEFRYANVPCVADSTGLAGSTACNGIGFGVTKPKIVRLPTGRWAAVFGNGYNSGDHRARLLVVDLTTGRLLYDVSSGVGSAAVPNGMSPVETTDWPVNNLNLNRVYAGDLQGNVWRIRFPSNGAAPTIARLFTATDAVGAAQPLTARPRVALRPDTVNQVIVTVGTGSYFRVGDDSTGSSQVQTFFGVFDNEAASITNVTRNDLLAQTLTANLVTVVKGSVSWPAGTLRYGTDHDIAANHKGWRMDLPIFGERVISEASYPSGSKQDRVRFTTLIPDPDPCGNGRRGFLMDVCLANGGECTDPTFDINLDGVIDANDNTTDGPPVGITSPEDPPEGEPLTVVRCEGKDCLYSGDGKKISNSTNNAGPPGRQSWRQIR